MRLFQAMILDEHLEGTGSAKSSHWWALLLGRAETLVFSCVADLVSGATPTANFALLGSNWTWDLQEVTKSFQTPTLQSGTTNLFRWTYSPQDATYPPPRSLYMQAAMSASDQKAHLRVWVCGRGPQLLEAMPPAAATFNAQYAAARMLEDEDRVSMKKRALPAGASLFYPPELFLPSLTWER